VPREQETRDVMGMEHIEQWKHLASFHELKGMGDEELGDYIEGLRVDLMNCPMTNSLPGSLIGFRAVSRELVKDLGICSGKSGRQDELAELEVERASRRVEVIANNEGKRLRNCQQRLPIVSSLIDYVENSQRRHDILVDRCEAQLSTLKSQHGKGDKAFTAALRQNVDGIKLSLAFFRVNFESIERLGKTIDSSGLLGKEFRFCEQFAMKRRFAHECLPGEEGILQAILDQLSNMSTQISSQSSSFWRLPKKFFKRRRNSREGYIHTEPSTASSCPKNELHIGGESFGMESPRFRLEPRSLSC